MKGRRSSHALPMHISYIVSVLLFVLVILRICLSSRYMNGLMCAWETPLWKEPLHVSSSTIHVFSSRPPHPSPLFSSDLLYPSPHQHTHSEKGEKRAEHGCDQPRRNIFARVAFVVNLTSTGPILVAVHPILCPISAWRVLSSIAFNLARLSFPTAITRAVAKGVAYPRIAIARLSSHITLFALYFTPITAKAAQLDEVGKYRLRQSIQVSSIFTAAARPIVTACTAARAGRLRSTSTLD
mmetsp:Transcript_8287/g.22016  ORF Transcript_8287/g.22016 Transcript_8287/m.22016 type:complete len:240 (+) Transcript_8287:307-1026(+)